MDEYSLAVFEDGTTEMIPKSWVQDYLTKNDPSSSSNENSSDLEEPPSKIKISSKSSNYLKRVPSLIDDEESKEDYIRKSIDSITKTVLENKAKIEKLQNTVENLIATINCSKEIEKSSLVLFSTTENKLSLARLQKSVDRLICIASGEPEPEINLSEPAETLDEFLQIEDYIKMKQNYNDLVCYLSKIGGKTVESTTRKIWKRLCSTQLASKICWTGANGKYCLKNLTINNLVRDAVLITHRDGKESEIQRATMLWFSHAQDRLRAKKNSTPLIGFKNAI
ncbi:uncharacterized protein LOC108737995 [Agrilus planipennis]|uniref:Uncharacterized protein LOC108737995 n=1 Tax=Agrilus planipennis TaxID=224129 RepID=A0A1W4WS12_AGRPL|nr:uncharacterized protein LOC108737995 [Agrilus planipennis]XP_018326700.1 uncharacterized protein LOC108737995 [Agrilus planipennis]